MLWQQERLVCCGTRCIVQSTLPYCVWPHDDNCHARPPLRLRPLERFPITSQLHSPGPFRTPSARYGRPTKGKSWAAHAQVTPHPDAGQGRPGGRPGPVGATGRPGRAMPCPRVAPKRTRRRSPARAASKTPALAPDPPRHQPSRGQRYSTPRIHQRRAGPKLRPRRSSGPGITAAGAGDSGGEAAPSRARRAVPQLLPPQPRIVRRRVPASPHEVARDAADLPEQRTQQR